MPASIGVFDSGLGGLSVLLELRRLLPQADLHYLADRGRAPYGSRPLGEVRDFAEQAAGYLIDQGAAMVVVACNAASTAALHPLRASHPGIPFVGMEPAVKPAAAATATGTIAVLTTAVTFQGELFASVVDRFSNGRRVVTQVCEGWVELVESGQVEGAAAEALVEDHLTPVLDAGADVLVLGCTHFPFLRPVIERVAPGLQLIDPAPAVARQAARVATAQGIPVGTGQLRFSCSGSVEGVSRLVRKLAGLGVQPEAVTWPPDG